jgi:hypothetical protein
MTAAANGITNRYYVPPRHGRRELERCLRHRVGDVTPRMGAVECRTALSVYFLTSRLSGKKIHISSALLMGQERAALACLVCWDLADQGSLYTGFASVFVQNGADSLQHF